VGELGSNDYAYILAGGKSLREAKSFVPEVVKAICTGIEVYIQMHVSVNFVRLPLHASTCCRTASAHAEAGGRGGEIRSGVGDAAGGVPTDGADQVRSGREAAAGGHEREERDGVLRPADGVLAAAQRAGGVPQLDAAGGRRPLAPKVPDHQARLRRLLPAGGAAPPAARQVR
jgi:hypothetical protein